MVAILVLIGQGKEDIGLVKELLDIDKHPCTPNYPIASGEPSRHDRVFRRSPML